MPPGLNALSLETVLDYPYSWGPLAGLAGRARRRTAEDRARAGDSATYQVWSEGHSENLIWPQRDYQVRPEMRDLGANAAEVLASLGVHYLLLTDFNPADPAPNRLEALVSGSTPLWVIDPGPSGKQLFEARLPYELQDPLWSLWQVERPGPRLSLYELPAAVPLATDAERAKPPRANAR